MNKHSQQRDIVNSYTITRYLNYLVELSNRVNIHLIETFSSSFSYVHFFHHSFFRQEEVCGHAKQPDASYYRVSK